MTDATNKPLALGLDRESLAEGLFTADRIRKRVTPDWIGLPRDHKAEWLAKADAILALAAPAERAEVRRADGSGPWVRVSGSVLERARQNPEYEVREITATPAEGYVLVPVIPAADAPVWAVGIVTDGERVSGAQKCEADYGSTYWATDEGDLRLDWEPDWFIDAACLPAAPTGGRS